MIDELRTASSALGAALRRYHDACSAIADSHKRSDIQEDILQGNPDVLLGELDRAYSHKNQLQQSISTISQTRNAIPLISPITILPPDILSQIFGAIIGMQPDYLYCLGDEKSYRTPRLKYPETLAHVCSRWRRLALGMRWLWTRIDLPFDLQMTSLGPLARAGAFAARAGSLLLDLDIHSGMGGDVVGTTLGSFCATIAPRTRSLSLSLLEHFHDQYIPVLEDIFQNCVPGVLDRLAIRSNVQLEDLEAILIESFEAPEREDDGQTLRIKLSQQQLDRCFLHVRTLELAGAYFGWDSQIYHNLTELHFFNSFSYSSIVEARLTESQLGQILRASPGLRALSLFITLITPQSCATVHLNELEVLNLGPMDGSTFQVLFRLISPGPKLDRVALNMRLGAFDDFKVSFGTLLSHPKVKWPHANHRFRNSPVELEVFEFFKSIPNLEVLVFSNLRLAFQINSSPLQLETNSSIERPRLETLYLEYCELNLDFLQRMTSIISVQTLVLLGCWVRINLAARGYIEAEAMDQELAKLVPTLKFIPVEEREQE